MKTLKLFTMLCLCLFSVQIINAQITSTQNGNWDDVNTWTGGVVPTAGDNVVISTGDTVVINIPNAECNDVTVDGALVYTPDGSSAGFTVHGNVLVN